MALNSVLLSNLYSMEVRSVIEDQAVVDRTIR